MLAAFLLGLTGSLGHCLGMCSGVALLLSRQGATRGPRLLLAHLGRITSYGFLGSLAGALGYSLTQAMHGRSAHQDTAIPGLTTWQGVLALITAVFALYMALALIGRAPSPELFFTRLTRWWGRTMRRFTAKTAGLSEKPGVLTAYLLGLLWGLLPCGLVMAALLTAAVAGTPTQGALTMIAFGLGTWPVTIGMGVIAQSRRADPRLALPWLRYVAAVVVLAFGVQMALRGLAAWGWVNHLHLGGVMLW